MQSLYMISLYMIEVPFLYVLKISQGDKI